MRVGMTLCLVATLVLPAWAGTLVPGGTRSAAVADHFATDPILDPQMLIRGAALERLEWQLDDPVFDGDVPGSLTADYTSTLDAGWFGWPLPTVVTEADDFTAAAIFEIDPVGFDADPDGFFQISFGLWNAARTGLERTGSPQDFSNDTYHLVELDWFPNVSPLFGGPYLAPSVFGAPDPSNPGLDALGALANAAFGFGPPVELPLGVPLMAVLEHVPLQNVLRATIYRIASDRTLRPLPGAATDVPLDALPLREYRLDTFGVTLWRDGFSGSVPSLDARVDYHSMVFVPRRVQRPQMLLRVGRR